MRPMSLRVGTITSTPVYLQIPYQITMTYLRYLQICYEVSTELLCYLHFYSIYNFSTSYLNLSMVPYDLYDYYDLYGNFQSLLM